MLSRVRGCDLSVNRKLENFASLQAHGTLARPNATFSAIAFSSSQINTAFTAFGADLPERCITSLFCGG